MNKKIIILIFLIILASGFFWNQKMFGQPIGSDQALYDSVAQNLLSSGGFAYQGREAGIEPLYPFFLAGIYAIFGHNYDAVRIIQIFLFALTVVFVYLLVEIADLRGLDADKRGTNKIALWSAMIIALFYGLANQAGNLTTETLFTFLLMIFVYSIYRASVYYQRESAENLHLSALVWFLVSGIILGLATLTRGIIQFFFVFAAINIFIVYFRKRGLKNAFVKTGIFLAAFSLVVLLWAASDRFNSATSAGAVAPRGGEILSARAELMENLYPDYPAHLIGHLFGYYFSQKIYPNVSSATFRETPYTEKRIADLTLGGKNAYEIDAILTAEAKKKILSAPRKYVLMSVLDFISFNSPIIPRGDKWQNTLTIHPMFAEGRHAGIPDWAKAIIILGIRFIWLVFIFLALYGAIKSAKNWTVAGWFILIIFYFNLTYGAVHAIPRYALPIYPFYVILAVVGIQFLWQKIKEKKLLSLRA